MNQLNISHVDNDNYLQVLLVLMNSFEQLYRSILKYNYKLELFFIEIENKIEYSIDITRIYLDIFKKNKTDKMIVKEWNEEDEDWRTDASE
jgi:hypothetical protein